MPVPNEIDAIAEPTAREAIAEQLRLWIIRGTLAPGEFLRDRDIAETLGVSRTPVREAFLQLEREGLIESTNRRWTRVTLLESSQLQHLYPVMIELESMAARLAAQLPVRNLEPVRQAQEAVRESVERIIQQPSIDNANLLRGADDGFHQSISQMAGNSYLIEALTPLKMQARRFETLYFRHQPAIGRSSVADHELIIESIARGDSETADNVMRTHWDRSRRAIESVTPQSRDATGNE